MKFGYKKNGVVRLYWLQKMLWMNGFMPSYQFRKGADQREITLSYQQAIKYSGMRRVMAHFLCSFGLHKPYPSYVYPACSVCGCAVFSRDHHKKWDDWNKK